MGKVRTYLVSFSPAERTEHGFRSWITVGLGAKATEVQAGDFATLESEVRKLAAAYLAEAAAADTPALSPYIRLKGRGERSAPGFDRWAKTLQIIDRVAAEINAKSSP